MAGGRAVHGVRGWGRKGLLVEAGGVSGCGGVGAGGYERCEEEAREKGKVDDGFIKDEL